MLWTGKSPHGFFVPDILNYRPIGENYLRAVRILCYSPSDSVKIRIISE